MTGPKRSTDRLSDRAIKAWLTKRRAGEAVAKKLTDGGGLYLMLTPAGTSMWRVKYRHAGAEKMYAAGTYPECGLADARAARDSVKAMLREGRDPVQARRTARLDAGEAGERTLVMAVEAWLEKRKPDWSDVHFTKAGQAIERDILPLLGKLPVGEITPAMIAQAIAGVSKRGAHETASRILFHLTGVFKLAQARGWVRDNPAVPVREELPKKLKKGKRPALLTFEALGDVLRRASMAPITPAVH
nr:integrase arm-type DNA-binding domain-containing protein [Gemmatimonadaceae bacterium]